jgi:hypothetical protein
MVLIAGLAIPLYAAIPPTPPLAREHLFFSSGILTGGRTPGRETSLLSVEKKTHRRQKRERIVLSIGDANGYPTEYLSYFHVAVDKNPPRLVVDMTRMRKTAVSEKDLVARLKNSIFIRSLELTMDPEDHSTNLTLNLKAPIQVSVHERYSRREGTQLVLDLSTQSQIQKVKDSPSFQQRRKRLSQ